MTTTKEVKILYRISCVCVKELNKAVRENCKELGISISQFMCEAAELKLIIEKKAVIDYCKNNGINIVQFLIEAINLKLGNEKEKIRIKAMENIILEHLKKETGGKTTLVL